MFTDFGPLPLYKWLIIAAAFCLTLPQGIWLFRDAQKRGRFPWLWGLWGLIQIPTPLIVYYFAIIQRDKKRKIK